jgi:hypothetical protein
LALDNEQLSELLRAQYEHEFMIRFDKDMVRSGPFGEEVKENGELCWSRNEEQAMQMMQDGHRMVDGHHEVSLPFKGGREEAAKVLPRKASEKPSGQKDYEMVKTQVQGYLDKCYARRVRPDKQTKVRLCHDAKARAEGVSLISVLHQGPDLENNLI